MRRLAAATLGELPSGIERPGYDRTAVSHGVVHIGVGAFHRAHQAVVFDDAIRAGDARWGIVGASLRSPAARDQLEPQDGLYTLLIRDTAATRARVIGALARVLVAPENPAAIVSALAHPDTHLVTLTITEKGYRDPATGAEPGDVSGPWAAVDFLSAGFAERRARGLPPFTAISCDNLPGNGRLLEAAVLAAAKGYGPALADWIAERGAFPATMVDRITPATTEADIQAWQDECGLLDRALVRTEPFTQWVIEDRFAGPRPDFEAFGVQLTRDVAPWETAKLRLLNGAHSAIACLGGLAGIDFVHEFVARPEGRAFVERLWDEAQATLVPPRGLDLAAYRRALMARFANPALQHRTRQIAMDGSQKLPQRLLAPIAARLDRGEGIDALALAVAAWMRWQGGRDESGAAFAVDDPLAPATARLLATAASAADAVRALLSLEAVFPPRLAQDPIFVASLTSAYGQLGQHGVKAVLGARG